MIRTFLFICLAASMVLLAPVGARAVGIGDKAPLFTAASDKGEVSLNNYLGQKYVIISFYFAINTPA
jgi:hypothetical protein